MARRSEELDRLYDRWYFLCGQTLQAERNSAERRELKASKRAVAAKIKTLEKSYGVPA